CLQAPGVAPALLAGASAGLMLATKETAPLALGCMLVAFALTRFVDRCLAGIKAPTTGVVAARDVLLALVATLIVAGIFFTSFLTRPEGLIDAVRAYGLYVDRARAASWHFHPWPY